MLGGRKLVGFVALGALAASASTAATAGLSAATPSASVVRYGWSNAAGYEAKWGAPYGPGEGTVTVGNGSVNVNAAPFTTAYDFSVFDHLKYIRVSNQAFAVPATGSLEIRADITAHTPGTEPGRVIHGCYGAPGSWDGATTCATPWSQPTFEGQQAGVVLNMINFATGQLFDWFVSENRVFALIERLPSNVTGVPGVGLDKAYTQIIKEAPLSEGAGASRKHTVSIRYTRGSGSPYVEYFLDGQLFTRVDNVGIPLDKQAVPYTGYAPSLGNGDVVDADSFVIGHGLFSLLDAFPYQHPDRPDLSVSIPITERLFGQGAIGTWKNFQVTTRTS
ncbi:MAG: DUF6081 family protein [Acidimicrobiia bacterium]